MDMHHLGAKEATVVELITALTLINHVARAEALLREASKCVPLCSNCHRMLHAGVLELPSDLRHPKYRLEELMRRLAAA
jgi:hypothetical protein